MKPAAPVTRHFDPRAASMGFLCARDVVTAARPHDVGRRLPERRCKLSAVPVLSPKARQIKEVHYHARMCRRGRRALRLYQCGNSARERLRTVRQRNTRRAPPRHRSRRGAASNPAVHESHHATGEADSTSC